MTSTSFSVVERFLGAANVDDMAALIHPKAVLSAASGFPYSGEWVGPQGLRDLVAALYGWFRLEVVSSELRESDHDLVLFLASCRFTARTTRKSIETRVCELYRVRDELIVAADIYYKDPGEVAALLDE